MPRVTGAVLRWAAWVRGMISFDKISLVTFCGICAINPSLRAEDVQLHDSSSQLGTSVSANKEHPRDSGEFSEHLLPDWEGYRSRLEDSGLEFSVVYIGEVLANVHGGLQRGTIYEGLLKVGVDLHTAPLGLWSQGLFHASMVYPHGEGLTEKYLGDLFTFSNIDAPNDPRLFEFWYQHTLASDALSVRIGQLAADEEFASTEYGATLVNGTCGWPAIIAVNAPTPAYPVATPGLRLRGALGCGWSLSTAIYNGQPCPVDDQGEALNDEGLYFKIKDAFSVTELRHEWDFRLRSTPLPGSARLGAWFHSGEFDDQHYDESGLSLGDPRSEGNPRAHSGNWGLYLATEQQVSAECDDPSQGLGTFLRLGFAPPDRNSLEFYVEGGVAWRGLFPNRDADALAFAVVYGQMSRHAQALGHDCNRNLQLNTPLPDYEMILEFTYKMEIHSGFLAQPVIGWVIHPGGSEEVRDAVVVGMRTTLDF